MHPLLPPGVGVRTAALPTRPLLLVFCLGLCAAPQIATSQVTAPQPPLFDVLRGLYDDPFAVTLTAPGGAVVRFTTDGSAPSSSHGQLYSGPVSVSSTTVLRAVAYDPLGTSPVATHTYLFLDGVVAQGGAPAGYPSQWNGYPADYAMDPEVTGPNAALMVPALRSLPSLSIVMDRADLFDPATGLYTNSEQDGVAWERPASAELLFPDGAAGFQINAGLRIHGGASRTPENSPKHSFRLLFKTLYGASELDFPLFGPTAVDQFDTLVLRAGYNNTWIHRNHVSGENQRGAAQYLRDQSLRDLQLAMGHPSAHGRYVHLYLNGLFWGLYNLVERPSAPFAAAYLGGDDSEYDTINALEAVDGDLTAWFEMLAIADGSIGSAAAYAAIQGYLDLDNFIDYMILNHWAGNHDWDSHNWYAARRRQPGAQFKFFSWDAEHTLESASEARPLDYDFADCPSHLLKRLLTNPEFVVRFGDRVHRHLFALGALTPAPVAAAYTALASEIEGGVLGESARWGDYRRDVAPGTGTAFLYTRSGHWAPERNRLQSQYFPVRTANLLALYRAEGLYPDVEAPVATPAGGTVPQGSTVTLVNANGAGVVLYTQNGPDPRQPGGATDPSALTYAGSLSLSGLTTLRARVRDGGQWSALLEAQFLPQQGAAVPVITELHYHPDGEPGVLDTELEFLEIHNPGPGSVNLSLGQVQNAVQFFFPPGFVLGEGEYYVLASNPTEFTNLYGFAPDGQYSGNLSNAGEQVTLLDGLGNLLDTVLWDDAAPWPLEADGDGPSLELLDPAFDNSVPSSWAVSLIKGGSPGTRNTVALPCAPGPAPVINEINYNSPLGFESGDWIELYNPGAAPLDLSGFVLRDAFSDFVLPPGTILPRHGHRVVIEDQAAFFAIHPTVFPGLVVGEFGFGLSGGGEPIQVLHPSGCWVDQVVYDDELPWPLAADGGGPTLILPNPALDNSQGSFWRPSPQLYGSPGRGNLPFFADGFESGNTAAWSSTVP